MSQLQVQCFSTLNIPYFTSLKDRVFGGGRLKQQKQKEICDFNIIWIIVHWWILHNMNKVNRENFAFMLRADSSRDTLQQYMDIRQGFFPIKSLTREMCSERKWSTVKTFPLRSAPVHLKRVIEQVNMSYSSLAD